MVGRINSEKLYYNITNAMLLLVQVALNWNLSLSVSHHFRVKLFVFKVLGYLTRLWLNIPKDESSMTPNDNNL